MSTDRRSALARTDSVDPGIVSAAIVGYLGWGRSPQPQANTQVIADLARQRDVQAPDLTREVARALAISSRVTVDGTTPNAAVRFKGAVRAQLPALEDDAIDALASRAFWYANLNGGLLNVPRAARAIAQPSNRFDNS